MNKNIAQQELSAGVPGKFTVSKLKKRGIEVKGGSENLKGLEEAVGTLIR